MSTFIDIQGFRGENNEFIAKEVAVLYDDCDDYQLFLIKPPYKKETLSFKVQRNINWLTKYYHGLSWTSGTISLKSLKKILISNLHGRDILVKGEEKKKYLEKLLYKKNQRLYTHISNLEEEEDFLFPSLKTLKKNKNLNQHNCQHHNVNSRKNCALENVFILKNFQLVNHKIE